MIEYTSHVLFHQTTCISGRQIPRQLFFSPVFYVEKLRHSCQTVSGGTTTSAWSPGHISPETLLLFSVLWQLLPLSPKNVALSSADLFSYNTSIYLWLLILLSDIEIRAVFSLCLLQFTKEAAIKTHVKMIPGQHTSCLVSL